MTARPLNILYAGTLPPHPGGSAISASQLLIGIARSGHRVRAIAPITAESTLEAAHFDGAHPELEVVRYQLEQYYTRVFQHRGAAPHASEGNAVRLHLERMAREERPDIVFAGREMYASYVPDAVAWLDVPLILRVAGGTLFGMVSNQYAADATRALITDLRRFHLLVTPAAYMARQLNDMGVPQTHVIMNAIDLEGFAPRPPDESLRRELHLAPADRVVLAIGNLHTRKRSMDIVAAVERVLAIEPGLMCVMAGAGPLGAEIERRIQAQGIADRFRLTGWISYDQVPRYLSIAEAVVHAAEGEGLARAWLESQAAGVPLVASDLEAVREIATNNETALLFPVGDVGACAEHVARLLRDAGLRQRLSRAARRRVAAHGLPDAVAAWVNTLRNLVRQHGNQGRSGSRA
jgi:glycosyltransferase involved in cell wall biosynthesis